MRALAAAALVGAALAVPAAAEARTVWLCHPDRAANACAMGLDTTRVSPAGRTLGVDRVRRARRAPVDCFYVYPTVSDQPGATANRAVDPALRSIARYQAARYGGECRVFAPVYRQITLRGINGLVPVTGADRRRAYRDVRDAWRAYLRRHDRGRGVVLIGHSQGTFMLRELIRREIDRRPGVRRRLVSALLLGGDVLRGEFRHVPPCRAPRQVGCVVAFSAFGEAPPPDAVFGRGPGRGDRVVCTNPAALGGGAGRITPMRPAEPFAPGTIAAVLRLIGLPEPAVRTPWIAFPGAYRARCSGAGGANVLRVEPRDGAPALRPSPNAGWGLHLADANIALGELVRLVRRQAAAWRTRRR